MLRVGVLSDAGEVRADLIDECLSLARLGTVEAALDHVVAKLVLHHVHKCTGEGGKGGREREKERERERIVKVWMKQFGGRKGQDYQ